jgi:hypothetical protein
MDIIPTMAYCVASSKKGLKGSGLAVGDQVLVVGTKVVPIAESDPYLQRVLFFCVRVTKEGYHEIPDPYEGEKSNGFSQYLIDPRCLTMLVKAKQDELKLGLHRQYAKEDQIIDATVN